MNTSKIRVDLSRQKELDADPKVNQQKEFFVQVRKLDNDSNTTDAGNDQSIFLTILEKNQRCKNKILSRKCNSPISHNKLWQELN